MDQATQSIPWLRRHLGAECVDVSVQGDQPLVLDDPRYAYVTLSEHHQLFCVGYRDGATHGRREHLATCHPGQVVFGLRPTLGRAGTALVLSGVTGSMVWRIPVASLFALAQQPQGRSFVAGLFESWVHLLLDALPVAPVPTLSRALQPGTTVEGDPEVALKAEDGIVWVAPAREPRTYAGIDVAAYQVQSGCWPLTPQVWALCGEEPFRVWSTGDLLRASGGPEFAEGFYAFALGVIAESRADRASMRVERDLASHRAEHDFLTESLGRLAAVGKATQLAEALHERSEFARACHEIFRALGLETPPRVVEPEGSALSHYQNALSRMTGVRARSVLLEGAWWKQDSGPMLGFVGGDEAALRPVALIRHKGAYHVHDPREAHKRRVVNAEHAEALHPQAHQFYRTLPSGPLRPFDVLRFARAGTSRDTAVVLLLGFAAGLLGTLVPLLTGLVFDEIIPGAERGLLLQLLLVLVAVFFGSSLFDLARGFSLVRVQTRMDSALEAGVWDRLLSLPLPFFRRYSAGDLAARASGIGSIREVLAQMAISSLLGGIFSVWNFALLFYFDVRLAAVATALVLAAAVVAGVATYYELQLQRRVVELDGKLGGLLLQLLNGIAKLRVSGGENRAFSVWANLFAQRRDVDVRAEHVAVRVGIFHAVFPVLSSMALYWFVIRGGSPSLSTGQFLAFHTAFTIFLRAVLEVINAGLQSLSVIPLYERAKPILTEEVESQGKSDARIDISGSIEVSHVSFRYEADGPLVLDDITLRIEPGEFVAIVGPSGSGKSTLLRILLGFEQPSEGGVYFDGQSLASMDVRAVRQQIGVVLQHSQVMAGDIYTNIVGNSGLTLEDAWRAARQAALDKDIEAMPMGMHTVLSQGGGTLSGGQRQRLLIARALASQPKILLFDEATSALDNRTQAMVSESLESLRVTRVAIAHRLSTVHNADRIVVLERGRIAQVGRFDDLLAEGGPFAALARRQMV